MRNQPHTSRLRGVMQGSSLRHHIKARRGHIRDHLALLRKVRSLHRQLRKLEEELLQSEGEPSSYQTFLVLLRKCLGIIATTSEALPLILEAVPAKASSRGKAECLQLPTPEEVVRSYSRWQEKIHFVVPTKILDKLSFPEVGVLEAGEGRAYFGYVRHHFSELLPDTMTLTVLLSPRKGRFTSEELAELEVAVEHIEYHALQLVPVLGVLADPKPWRYAEE